MSIQVELAQYTPLEMEHRCCNIREHIRYNARFGHIIVSDVFNP